MVEDKLLKVRQAAEQLGYTERTLYSWIYAGKLPATKIGAQWRIRQSVVDTIREKGLEAVSTGGEEQSGQGEGEGAAGAAEEQSGPGQD